MLLQQKKKLPEILVLELSKSPGATAHELEERITKEYGSFSLRAIYKDLKILEAQGLVVKLGEMYYIRLSWIFNMLDFVDELYTVYSDPNILERQIDDESGKGTWKFSNLRNLDLAWTQLILGLHERFPEKLLFLWAPYRFFHLVHSRKAEDHVFNKHNMLMKARAFSDIKRYHIYGKECYLAKIGLADDPGKTQSFAPGPFADEKHKYYSLIEDYVITVTMDKNTIDRVEKVFEAVKSEKDIVVGQINSILNSRIRASLVWERHPEKAKRLRKKFADYFGLSVDTCA